MDVLSPHNPSSPKQIVFLSGLPRTGSTLLTAILRQNPDIYTSGSSPLYRLLWGAQDTCNFLASESLLRTQKQDFVTSYLTKIPELFYGDIKQQIIVDKDRDWGKSELMYFCNPRPRVLVMLRPITEITKSFVDFFTKRGDVRPTSGVLRNNDPFLAAIKTTAYCLRNVSPIFLFGKYDTLVNEPDLVMQRLYDFWQIETFMHDFSHIIDPDFENEAMLGLEGLHKVRHKLEKREYEVTLPEDLWRFSQELDDALWHDYEEAKKILPSQFI